MQSNQLEQLTLEIDDIESLLQDVSDVAYEKAVEEVTNEVMLKPDKMISDSLKEQELDRPATTQSFGERKELCKKSFGWCNKKNHESYDGSSNSKRFVTAAQNKS